MNFHVVPQLLLLLKLFTIITVEEYEYHCGRAAMQCHLLVMVLPGPSGIRQDIFPVFVKINLLCNLA